MATVAFKREPEVDPSKVQKGQLMAFLYWAHVDDVSGGGAGESKQRTVECTNLETGSSFHVTGNDIIEQAMSADLYEETVKTTMSDMAARICRAHRQPFTVCFTKKDGTERKLRGYLLDKQPDISLGRVRVKDLDVPMDNKKGRVRWVDLRTINSLIVGNVRYKLK